MTLNDLVYSSTPTLTAPTDVRSVWRFYPRDAMLARVIAIAACPSVRHAPVLSKQSKLASWFLHQLVAPWFYTVSH